MRRVKNNPARGSYIPMLFKAMNITTGPVLELGCGNYSTPFMHWLCFAAKRRLVSYENDRQWYEYAKGFASDYHGVHFVEDWDKIDLSEQWDVALVDHEPHIRRSEDLKRLTHANFVVIHDTEAGNDHKYCFKEVEHLYRYRYRYDETLPYTSVWSNTRNLENFRYSNDGSPPPLDEIQPVSDRYMMDCSTFVGEKRPYTICIALGRIYSQVQDPEIRLKLRYASTIAQYIIAKMREYNPTWVKQFYPRFIDYDRLMRR